MASMPDRLKGTAIAPFAIRAAQLEKAKPVVAYWCEYWVVNQILAQKLHEVDESCLHYVTSLMDKLEKTKAEHAEDEAIIDDIAGQAYIEQFGNETFERAERVVHASKVTNITADTYKAAGTFLELVNIWGPPAPEILAKIKYAKYHAIRILRAVKEGKDPNESNPKLEPEPEDELAPLDPNDPEVIALSEGSKARQPSVEEVPDEQDQVQRHLAAQSILDRSLHPSAQPSARGSPKQQPFDPYPRNGFPYNVAKDDVSPIEPTPNDRDGSVGGGYFPEVPTFTSDSRTSTLPTAPAEDSVSVEDLHSASTFPPPTLPPPTKRSTDTFSSPPPPSNYIQPPPAAPQDFYRQQPPPPSLPQYVPAPVTAPAPAPVPAPMLRQQAVVVDDVAIAKAQKHAKWAISALNFEDTNTAIEQLREALKTLGA